MATGFNLIHRVDLINSIRAIAIMHRDKPDVIEAFCQLLVMYGVDSKRAYEMLMK